MKVLYCALKYDYGDPGRGIGSDETNIGDALRHMKGVGVVSFHFDVVRNQGSDVNTEFLNIVRKERPEVTLVVLFEDYLSVEALDEARTMTTLVSWGCDDHWQFTKGYMQHYAPHFDYCITTHKPALSDYQAVGQRNVIASQWGCNERFFHPSDKDYLYDVSFVGANYGPRKVIIDHLWERGIEVKLFGSYWPKTRQAWNRGRWFSYLGRPWHPRRQNQSYIKWLGHWWRSLVGKSWGYVHYVTPEQMVEIYGRSKINISLNNNVTGIDNIKGRNFEVPACRGFLICGHAFSLEEFFAVGKEVVVYKDVDDLSNKIFYYLSHENEREEIALAGYQRVLRDHTYDIRFKRIFSEILLPEIRTE